MQKDQAAGDDPDDGLLLPDPDIQVSDEALAEVRRLYHEAFARYGAIALWSLREHADPTPGDALAITQALRIEGNMASRRLAERIEALCRAH